MDVGARVPATFESHTPAEVRRLKEDQIFAVDHEWATDLSMKKYYLLFQYLSGRFPSPVGAP